MQFLKNNMQVVSVKMGKRKEKNKSRASIRTGNDDHEKIWGNSIVVSCVPVEGSTVFNSY